jgi:hypothetical protein
MPDAMPDAKPRARKFYERVFPDYRSAETCPHEGPRFRLVNGQEACALCVHVVEAKTELPSPTPFQIAETA